MTTDKKRDAELLAKTSLSEFSSRFPLAKRIIVGLSGGVDSTVLLRLVKQAMLHYHWPVRCLAVHVNHQLQPVAGEWVTWCQQYCQQLGIDYISVAVDATPLPGESPEAKARQARYAAFEDIMQLDDVLVLAHHADDQAETILLQLLRGAGSAGLAGMPVCAPFGQGALFRPLLSVDKAALTDYADDHVLAWCEDPTNQAVDYDRNYLRHAVMPVIAERWPGAVKTLVRSGQIAGETKQLLLQLAKHDWQSVSRGSELQVEKLLTLDRPRRANLLRYWLHREGATTPNRKHIEQIERGIGAKQDAKVCIQWSGGEVRRFNGYLYGGKPLKPFSVNTSTQWHDLSQPLLIEGHAPLHFSLFECVVPMQERPVTVRFRQGGERIAMSSQGRKLLKHCFQERGVPPWLRGRIPLLYAGDELIGVAWESPLF